jgi:hypothetical protein
MCMGGGVGMVTVMEQLDGGRRLRSELERQNRQAALTALGQAVRAYWEHVKALPMPDHLANLATSADEACRTKPVANVNRLNI